MDNRAPKKAILMVLGLAFGARLLLSLTADGLSGIDAGAYLNHALGLLGRGAPGLDPVTRPPLAPGFLLVPFIEAFGLVNGYNAFSAVFAMTLPVTVAWVSWRMVQPWQAVAATAIAAFEPLTLGLMVMGVLPIIGFSLLLLASYGLWRGNVWLIAVPVVLVVFVNQTATGIGVLVLGLQWALLDNKRRNAFALATGAGVAAAFAWPWYFATSPFNSGLAYPGPLVLPQNLWSHQLWLGIAVLFVLTRLPKPTEQPWRAITYVVAFLAVFQMFQSFNEVVMNLFFRSTYLMLAYLTILVARYVLLPRLARARAAALGAAAVALVLTATVVQVRTQQDLSGYGTGDVLTTIRAIDGPVATNSQTTAFVIGAVQGVRNIAWTGFVEPAPAYAETERRARCAFGWERCAVDVSYVFIDTRLPLDGYGFAPDDIHIPYGAPERRPWGALDNAGWLELLEVNGTARLYKVAL